MDWLEGIFVSLVAAALFVVGALFGSAAYDDSWKNDCEQLRMHRTNNGVYDCAKRPAV